MDSIVNDDGDVSAVVVVFPFMVVSLVFEVALFLLAEEKAGESDTDVVGVEEAESVSAV